MAVNITELHVTYPSSFFPTGMNIELISMYNLYFQVTKKLAGDASRTASWATNVGNEFGQVLMSVLTVTEGAGLEPMCQGIVQRYLFHILKRSKATSIPTTVIIRS